jgi:hypothetical protein
MRELSGTSPVVKRHARASNGFQRTIFCRASDRPARSRRDSLSPCATVVADEALTQMADGAVPVMTRITRRSWTPEQIDLLRALIDQGASPARASVALKRPQLAVQNKARQLGKPFPDIRNVRAARLAREAIQREAIERRHEGLVNHEALNNDNIVERRSLQRH